MQAAEEGILTLNTDSKRSGSGGRFSPDGAPGVGAGLRLIDGLPVGDEGILHLPDTGVAPGKHTVKPSVGLLRPTLQGLQTIRNRSVSIDLISVWISSKAAEDASGFHQRPENNPSVTLCFCSRVWIIDQMNQLFN